MIAPIVIPTEPIAHRIVTIGLEIFKNNSKILEIQNKQNRKGAKITLPVIIKKRLITFSSFFPDICKETAVISGMAGSACLNHSH